MTLSRRAFMSMTAAGLLAPSVGRAAAPSPPYAPVRLENGRYAQPWFLNSFLELADDLAEAGANGKRFAILWNQEGCPYCRETHLVNFAIPEVTDYVRANFDMIQLDIWGARTVVDFDGTEMSEKDLAKRNQVRFTPTIQFFPESFAATPPAGKAAEVARMPGYFRPFHFLTMFEYVRADGYAKGPFRKFLGDKVAALKAKGQGLPQW
ncbi:MAG: thioredoxin family protein [Rhodospirillaceae bacterium]